MAITLTHSSKKIAVSLQLSTSKSESNRVLIIQAILNNAFKIKKLSKAEDTVTMQKLLAAANLELNVGHAGTTMRFLTAFLATQQRNVILTGSERMQQRPIKILVDALNQLGANIEYLKNDGFPPLKINKTKQLIGGELVLDGSISSQYISALLLIAPTLKKGLILNFKGKIISKPYLAMTIAIIQRFGAEVHQTENKIIVKKTNYYPVQFEVETDWSSASYWFSVAALSENAEIEIKGLKPQSLQGDSKVVELYEHFGIATDFIEKGIRIYKTNKKQPTKLPTINFEDFPDLAQTFAVTAAALNVSVCLTGLSTLRIKETDRIAALQHELTKCGFNVEIKGNDLQLHTTKNRASFKNVSISTYHDHRMAMAFAPLSLIYPISIEDEEVVKKSYPTFWKDLKKAAFQINNK